MIFDSDIHAEHDLLVWCEYRHDWLRDPVWVDTLAGEGIVRVEGRPGCTVRVYGDFHVYDRRTGQPLEPDRAPRRAQIPRGVPAAKPRTCRRCGEVQR